MSDDELLTPSEVASMFRVDVRTVGRWARTGDLPSVKTLGGHHRFRKSVIVALIEAKR